MIALDVLKAVLGTDQVKSDPDRDTVLPALEAAAVDFVSRETGRYFGPSITITEYLEGNGGRLLWLKEEPASLTTVDGRDEIGDAWTAIAEGDTDGWELRGARVLRKGGAVWERCSEYRFVYPFGYTAGLEPTEIRQLVTDLVALRWRQRGVEGHASGGIGDYSFTLSDIERIPGAREVLDRWTWDEVVAG